MSAENRLESSAKYPYDAPDDDAGFDKTPIDWAHAAARGVIYDLSGRGGIGNALDDIDEDIRVEIVSELAAIIRLAQKQNP